MIGIKKITSVFVLLSVTVAMMAHPGHHHEGEAVTQFSHQLLTFIIPFIIVLAGVYAYRAIKLKR